ncbi:MAG: hypothetical protein EG824_06915 [Deltaproteobacteria bacterium]|nr:hypothetical protein [Deltaproteobacteria bacterium]
MDLFYIGLFAISSPIIFLLVFTFGGTSILGFKVWREPESLATKLCATLLGLGWLTIAILSIVTPIMKHGLSAIIGLTIGGIVIYFYFKILK